MEKRLNSLSGEESSEAVEMPIYKCRGKGCGFTTDDLGALLEHHDEHLLEKVRSLIQPTVEEPKPEPKPKKRHKTVRDFLTCPECRPAFEKAFMEMGWTPPKKSKAKRRALW